MFRFIQSVSYCATHSTGYIPPQPSLCIPKILHLASPSSACGLQNFSSFFLPQLSIIPRVAMRCELPDKGPYRLTPQPLQAGPIATAPLFVSPAPAKDPYGPIRLIPPGSRTRRCNNVSSSISPSHSSCSRLHVDLRDQGVTSVTSLLSPQIVLVLLVSSLRMPLRQATYRGVVPRIPQKLHDSRDPSADDLRRGCMLGWAFDRSGLGCKHCKQTRKEAGQDWEILCMGSRDCK